MVQLQYTVIVYVAPGSLVMQDKRHRGARIQADHASKNWCLSPTRMCPLLSLRTAPVSTLVTIFLASASGQGSGVRVLQDSRGILDCKFCVISSWFPIDSNFVYNLVPYILADSMLELFLSQWQPTLAIYVEQNHPAYSFQSRV